MIAVFDLGNSDLSFAIYQNYEMIGFFRTHSDRSKSVDEYVYTIKGLIEAKGIDISKITGAIFSSVVPSLTNIVKTSISRLIKDPLVLGPGVKTGLSIRCDNPNELGSDIVACCVGAINKYSVPCIVADFGTATKIIAINKDKAFIGCSIAPGVKTSAFHLVSIASQLPEISFEVPERVISTNTVDCMNSGIVIGSACMIEGMVKRFEEEMKCECDVIITGGLGSTVCKAIKNIDYKLDKRLIFDGLLDIYYKNEANKNEK